MLESWVIEKILRHEREREAERPQLQIEAPQPMEWVEPVPPPADEPRGVIVIEL